MAPLPPSRILDRTTAVLNELRVYPAWTASLEQATARTTPLFVASIAPPPYGKGQRLPDYFIVEIQRGHGVSARFAHHAETGAFLEAEAVQTPGAVLREYVDPKEPLPSKIPATSQITPAPEMVWQPCIESTTRFLPFWRFRVGGQLLYLRADGVLFENLTVNHRG
jgi:hypothetical protein